MQFTILSLLLLLLYGVHEIRFVRYGGSYGGMYNHSQFARTRYNNSLITPRNNNSLNDVCVFVVTYFSRALKTNGQL